MNPYRESRLSGGWAALAVALALLVGCFALAAGTAWAQRPSTDGHVRELGRYLDGVKIAAPTVYRQLAVYPIFVDNVPLLRGRWLTLDGAVSRGVLLVTEKGGGNVPLVWVENRSRDESVFIMTGEVIAGGMQTRTVRHDLVLAPGQKIDLEVFCVEAHRWSGDKGFSSGDAMLPQSIQGELRKGADQGKLWSEVARNNAALNTENATGSLDLALKARPVKEKLDEVRHKIMPEVPRGATGFIFVDRGQAVGAELFGSADLARGLLPKLLDSYAVDYVILKGSEPAHGERTDNRSAIGFFERVCRAGSERSATPGSGSGLRTREGGLLGDGVSLDSALVHYGVQPGHWVAPRPEPPRPPIIYPDPDPSPRPPIMYPEPRR